MVVDHIGYLCKDIEKSIEAFERLGYTKKTEIINDNQPYEGNPPRNVYLCFMQLGDTCIELVSPNGTEPSAIGARLLKQGEGPYHICYRVENLAKALQELSLEGWITATAPAPAIAFGQAPVAFLFKNSVGMIELVER